MPPELPRMPFPDADAFEAWIADEGARAGGVWLMIAKKGNDVPSITRQEAVDVALCNGWIDGQIKGVDEKFYSLRFTPRRPRSVWSQINTERVGELIAEGRMKPPGLAEVEAAKADGRWDAAYAPPSRMEISPDLAAALAADPAAAATFEGLKASERYAVNYRLHQITRAEDRAARIASYVETLRAGKAPHPQR